MPSLILVKRYLHIIEKKLSILYVPGTSLMQCYSHIGGRNKHYCLLNADNHSSTTVLTYKEENKSPIYARCYSHTVLFK